MKGAILSDITEWGKKEGLQSFEQVRPRKAAQYGCLLVTALPCPIQQAKAIYLCPEPFSVDNELLTPTHKLVRRNLEKRFMTEFDRMYAELPK